MTDSVNWPALYEIGLLNIYDFISQDKPFPEAKHYPRRVCGQVLRENNRDPAERRREPPGCIAPGPGRFPFSIVPSYRGSHRLPFIHPRDPACSPIPTISPFCEPRVGLSERRVHWGAPVQEL